MEKVPGRQFSSPEEEIAYLRSLLAARPGEVEASGEVRIEANQKAIEATDKEGLRAYGQLPAEAILPPERRLDQVTVGWAAESVAKSDDPVETIVSLALERGIHNALSVMEKANDAFSTDEVHRRLIELIREGQLVAGLKEGVPPWHILHMTLFEVSLPDSGDSDETQQLSELAGLMEQFYAGLQSVGVDTKYQHYALEIAVAEGSDDIVFYVAVPSQYVDLFHKQTLALYPSASLIEQPHDYNIFVPNGQSVVARASLEKYHIYPLANRDSLKADPMAILLNAFSKIERQGGGAALQMIVHRPSRSYTELYEGIVNRVRDGLKPKEAIARSSFSGDLISSFKDMVMNKGANDTDKPDPTPDQEALELFAEKKASPVVEVNLRLVASSTTGERAGQILSEIEAVFNQFARQGGNRFVFKPYTGRALTQAIRSFSFREFLKAEVLPLSISELSTILHFPGAMTAASPQFKQAGVKTAAAPTLMPEVGTLLGLNEHRGGRKEIRLTEEDRLRHFYIIGQTGTGKTTLMKNMLIQDIEAGAGVCFIDPHGTDIEDVLGSIPEARYEDVVYFDPARLDQVVGLNMLEYDQNRPEQKTFVVNELFSIFKKLYGANPEALGPMFEQYFRNATLLVMDDPDSGNTLMDISRVMSDSTYRRLKLERAQNPVVTQFWREIATKAGGEASLENIVPYIVSKFDVFTANEYMRPIIGQQHSSFNFRQLMDERKILLVNLSKGRLGEINANLIGMIIVGKLLMAALSRVDDASRSFAPFYLHMDEFQNISTDSIVAILSEARKYKLGLTIAHQFIAQLDEEIKEAVFGNVGSLAAFRVGPEDAHFLENQFQPTFDHHDLIGLPNRTAYLRILADGVPTRPFSLSTMAPPEIDPSRVGEIVKKSYAKYGRPKEEVEASIRERYQQPSAKNDDLLSMM